MKFSSMSKDGSREREETACQTVKLESNLLAVVLGYTLSLHTPQPNSCIFWELVVGIRGTETLLGGE